MPQNDSLTTEEIANLLKVSKLTVYDLIKKGELPSYRVGRQIRVERHALEAYKNKGNVRYSEEPLTRTQQNKCSIIISGQDNCLDILAKNIDMNSGGFQALRSYTGSLDGLLSMYQGKADIVSTHLFDGDTGTYNLPYIRKILVSKSFVVIHLLKRKAGLYVAKNNPKGITGWKDFNQPNLQMVNREPGAGARVLLDEHLRLLHIRRDNVNGYRTIVQSHIDVASAIANGQADIGVGAWQAAKMANIDFIPMIEEDYDLVILKSDENNELIETILHTINDNEFQLALQSLNYNTSNTGKIIYEQ